MSGPQLCPARTPGTLGVCDAGDPNVRSHPGATPGTTGVADGAALQTQGAPQAQGSPESMAGQALVVGSGAAAIVRIPVPGTGGLALELSPRGWVPKGGSTSTLFVQSLDGKRNLRLDYGYNVTTKSVNYHWNQKGTFAEFKIADHALAGGGGKALYNVAKVAKVAGRGLLVVGAVIDAVSIVQAKKRWRQVAKVLAGWGGAWVGCKAIGAAGAAGGTLVEPGGGTAVGGFVGCAVGGALGYFGSSLAAETLYDWVEETWYDPLPQQTQPWSAPQ